MKHLSYLVISFFLLVNAQPSIGQGNPLIEDHQMAIAIQEEMENWGDKVSISDAFTIMRMLGFSQETHGGEDIPSDKADYFHSKITYDKNTALTGVGVLRDYINKAFANAQEFNAGFDFIGGITLSQKMPIYKFGDLGKEGLIETKHVLNTYDYLPPQLDKYFKAVSYGSYCWHVGTTLYDATTKGVQRSSTASYAKLVTGAIGVTATAVGGPVAVFVGAALWIFEQSLDMMQSQSNRYEEELAYGDFKLFYLRYNNNKGINWVNKLNTGSKWSEILTILREYWKADFTNDPNGADKETHRNLVKELYTNYEDRFAYRFVNEFIVPDMISFFQRESERSKEEAIASLKEYIASLYDQKTTIRMKLAYQDFSGRKMDVYPPIKLTITDLYEKEELDEFAYEVKKNGPNVEIYIDKIDYLTWLTKNKGTIYFKIETEKNGKVTQHLMSPNWINPELGEDGDGYPVRIEYSERGMNVLVDVPIEVNIASYDVIVQVVGLSGEQLDAGISIQGPDGKRVETNNQGEVLINVPTIGKSWVYEVDHYGGLNGGKAQLPEKPVDVTKPVRVILKSLLYKKSPPWPTFSKLDLTQIKQNAQKAIRELERGDIDINSASRLVSKAISSIEIKLTDYYNDYENSKNLYLKKAAADEIPPDRIKVFLEGKRALFDQDYKDAYALQKSFAKELGNAQQMWNEKKEALFNQIKGATDALNELRGITRKDAITFNKHSSSTLYYLNPHTFRTLSLVENEMQLVDNMKADMEAIAGRAKHNEPIIAVKTRELERLMEELTAIRKIVNLSKSDYRYREALDAVVNAFRASEAIKMFLEYEGIEQVIRQMDYARSNLSWVQLRALEHIELMKAYEAQINAKPYNLKEDNPLFDQAEQLREYISDTKASVKWASGIEFRNRRRGFTSPDGIPARHNGFGVDAWPSYVEVSKTSLGIISALEKTADISEKWSNEIDTLRKKIIEQKLAMINGGWVVEDISMSMDKVLSTPFTGLHMEKSIRREVDKFKMDVDNLDNGFKLSIVNLLAPMDKAYKDAQEYRPILQEALRQAKLGNLEASETALNLADQLIPTLAKTPTPRGSANYREVLMDKETFEMEEELENLLFILRKEAYEASLAHLTLDVQGGDFQDLSIQVLDKDGNDVGFWIDHSCTLESGQYTIILSSLGNRINPSEKTINLAEGEKYNLPVVIEKPINTNTGSLVISSSSSNYDFQNTKKRVFTYNANTSMEAPSWSEDSKILVIKSIDGLTAYDLQKNEKWVVTSDPPLPPPGWQDATINSSYPEVVGNSVVYQMAMSGYSLSDGSRETYWMVVPLEGGQPSAVFQELSDKFKIITTREKKGQIEYLLLGSINDQTGLFILEAGLTDYRQATLIHALSTKYVRVFISDDWKLVCFGDINYRDGYEIYNVGGTLIQSFPQEFMHTMTFSPDNKYIAGHQRLNEAPWNRIVVVPLDNFAQINVVDADPHVKRFDEIAWSPDGRYLAYQRGVESPDINKEIEFVVVDLTGKDHSLAEGKVITRARSQSGLNTTSTVTKDQTEVISAENNNHDPSDGTPDKTKESTNNAFESGEQTARVTALEDDFNGSLDNWDVSNINAEVSEGHLFWNEGNHKGVFSNFTIPLDNIIIEFDGWTASNGIAFEWKDQNNNGYNVSLGAYYNTATYVGKITNGNYDWKITKGSHIKPNMWQHYKFILDDQSVKAYLDNELIDTYPITTTIRGRGQIRFSSYNTRIGIDNVRIYAANHETAHENNGQISTSTITMSCLDKENDEKGCCCFQGAHTYSFSPVKVQSFDATFDTGRGTNCKSNVSIQINSEGHWTTAEKIEAVSGKGSSGANPITVKINVNRVIQGIRISDGCACCIDDSKVTIYTESQDFGNEVWPNLIQNGGFEKPVIGSYKSFGVGQDIAGWKVVKEFVDLTGTYFKSSEGSQSLDLYGTPGIGAIEQSFVTVPQQKYEVSFDLAGNPYAPMVKELIVSAGAERQKFTFDCTGKNTGQMGWEPQSWSFTATGTISTLRFESLPAEGLGRYGPAIDNVVVVPTNHVE